MRVLIVGCGYVGLPLGAELVRLGHEVFGLRRSAAAENELKAAGIQPLFGDVTRPETLAKLPREFDWVVNCVAAGGGAENYRQIYLEGNAQPDSWLADSPPKKFVYTSSTSVYGQNDGSQVTEKPDRTAGGNRKGSGRNGESFAGGGGRTQIPGRDSARGRHLRAGTRPLVQGNS
jgi:nucleoside-diphosphate-sugar epimerase